ncbi:MAG: hypothetical protein KKA65_05075 [Nanoarchaeota archaeon]|nr:hypothetical protein [Nanoarchaeota archaeon]MBU4241721.1 hypothetical protein [Nanoarchaeota archaeon]MBU4351766.1 hypothetical protein [Nanoarchaeota archaeon]MBU4456847.1 hypothetical protein [Nanoarchaeota archaeon]MCG2719462.1 hypothetical protein [Nanoarchaeota archaeon]
MEELELKNRTIDALLLGFKDPIAYDLCIPSLKVIFQSVQYSIIEGFKSKYPHLKANYYEETKDFFREGCLRSALEPIKDLQTKVKDSLISVLAKTAGCDYEGGFLWPPYMETAFKDLHRYREVNFSRHCSIYKFKEPRENVKKEVKKHFNAKEMKNFYKLHKHMRAYLNKRLEFVLDTI